ncbi:hypothetical protein HID58_058121, partial [Brassica napus]
VHCASSSPPPIYRLHLFLDVHVSTGYQKPNNEPTSRRCSSSSRLSAGGIFKRCLSTARISSSAGISATRLPSAAGISAARLSTTRLSTAARISTTAGISSARLSSSVCASISSATAAAASATKVRSWMSRRMSCCSVLLLSLGCLLLIGVCALRAFDLFARKLFSNTRTL